ncbi:hypothetical protein L873DRAFT_1795606 [Choiromyces venosus 120613-1]|uniref:Uncharacterized protein n=1 Tax=Choiromyces venosus 120613-1 TaxID=1336337 RepID=A0A3N4IVM0_9PEZI|nr:hypothetical protein L873DRAFT_1795606 [Choiromyces venosus 120613-1]
MLTVLQSLLPERQSIPTNGAVFLAESEDLLIDLGPSPTQEKSKENVNGYMKDLETLIPIHDLVPFEDAPVFHGHPILLPLYKNQVLLKPPPNTFDSGGRKFNHESDLIDITSDSTALSSSNSISSLGRIENSVQNNPKNLERFQEEDWDTDHSDTEEIRSKPELISEPKNLNVAHPSAIRLQRQEDFSKW